MVKSTPGFAKAHIDRNLKKAENELAALMSGVNFELTEVRIDVFGFSRGAALARHFYNRISEINPNLVKNFLGVFDTVVSAKQSGLDTRVRDCDRNIVHLCALHEVRQNFSLLRISHLKNTENYFSSERNLAEIFLPGAHSDVGGGYVDIEDEHSYIGKETSIEKMRGDHDWRWLFSLADSKKRCINRVGVRNDVRIFYYNLMIEMYSKYTGQDNFEPMQCADYNEFKKHIDSLKDTGGSVSPFDISDVYGSLHNSSTNQVFSIQDGSDGRGGDSSSFFDVSPTDQQAAMIIDDENRDLKGASVFSYTLDVNAPRVVSGRWARLIRQNGTYPHDDD